jgi:protein-tyrosine phosphatase
MYNILFICMGNICRSPAAEGFFKHHLQKSTIATQVATDSAATHAYHLGNPPDPRAVAEAGHFGVDISQLRARKITQADFAQFDLILGMDQHNLAMIEQMQPGRSRAQTGLMMDYAAQAGYEEVPDPYYGTQKDFTLMCELLDQATRNLTEKLAFQLES